ncbi:MAG: UDP-glucose/GDP-mannose dehydrogenase family protein [Acidimicrobiia bacterium]|nr:UDP-glucose/GDP-mannose dehydrogenase family protein [Acidimicrobiia bacterium]MBJ7514462.1 UDP-glucose/GDP-mannose dehydrogenase family protein [Acidimicrobiia bacterium]
MGAGYVGITTAACLAHLGHSVVAGDIDPARVDALNRGEIPIHEDGLSELVAEGLESGRLRFVLGASVAVADAEFIFLCVPTPQGDDGSADLSFIDAVVFEIAGSLRSGSVVINKSTVPVGTTRRVQRLLGEAGGSIDEIGVASNPEFLREGTSVRDFLHASRVVVGCDNSATAVRVSELYAGVLAPIVVTDPASAEMIKYASNAFLATKISFMNAIANLCEALDADVSEVALGMGYDTRIGFEFLQPGPGYGGSCFPKDTSALMHAAHAAGAEFPLLQGVIDGNVAQHERMIDKAKRLVGGDLRGVEVAILGLAFKANTDDVRDSPAVYVARRLSEEGAILRAYDPKAAANSVLIDSMTRVDSVMEAAKGASLMVVLTEWDEFRWLNFDEIGEALEKRIVLDTRNILDPVALRRRGWIYEGVGR